MKKHTRQPFSIKAKPSAAARWDFPAPGGPKHKRLAPFSSQASPAASACTRLRDHRHCGEVERVEGLSRRQSRFLQMPFEATAAPLHHLLFGEGRQEAGGG